MYVPDAFRETDPAALAALMQAYPFATLVTVADGRPFASHIPVQYDNAPGPHGRLVGHVARANPQAAAIDAGQPALLIMQGPHAYVSPAWYEAEGPAVPTWNYVAVHAHGRLSPITERTQAEAVLQRLVETFEAGQPTPWRMALPERYLAGMVNGIRAFSLAIERIDGKRKLSQNRSVADRRAVIRALERAGDAASNALAQAMTAALPAASKAG